MSAVEPPVRYHSVTYEVTVLVPSADYRPAERVSLHQLAERCATGSCVATLPRIVESLPLRSAGEIAGFAHRFGFADIPAMLRWAREKAGLSRASHPAASDDPTGR